MPTSHELPAISHSLASFIDTVAGRHADRPALIGSGGQISFCQLAQRADDIACALATFGAGKGTRVGILMPNRPDWLATAFAAWKLGAVVVPLNTLSRPPELEHSLRHADVNVLITVPTFLKHDYADMLTRICPELENFSRRDAENAGGIRATSIPGGSSLRSQRFRDKVRPSLRVKSLPSLRHVVFAQGEPRGWSVSLDAMIATGVRSEWLRAVQTTVMATDVASIFFTSGTTALPKGVVHTHASMWHAAGNVADTLGLDEDDRTWGYLPFFFTGGLVAVALATLSRGGAVLLQEVFDAGETLKLMSQHRCTTLFAWPHQAEALIAHPDFATTKLHLRKGVGANTGWASRLYPPDHRAVGTWGMTETGPMATASSHDDPLEVRAGAHGRAQPGVELRVIAPETGRELGEAEEGELLVRGAPLMQHYYKVARADCFDADGFFHTGDLARIDAGGLLHFLGRLKDVIKTAGVNVAAAEVEAVLQQHPAVKVAHVVGVPHPTRGEDVGAVVILNPPATGHEPPATDLIEFCKQRLASYKVPRRIVFMTEGDLPTLGSGKVDKQALRRSFAEA